LPEIPEVRDMSLIDDIRPYGGREPENPIGVVAASMREKNQVKAGFDLLICQDPSKTRTFTCFRFT
jgi:hypothetical protein